MRSRLLLWLVLAALLALRVRASMESTREWDDLLRSLPGYDPRGWSPPESALDWIAVGGTLLLLVTALVATLGRRWPAPRFVRRGADNRHLQAFVLFYGLLVLTFFASPGVWIPALAAVAPALALLWVRVRGGWRATLARHWGLHGGNGFWREAAWGAAGCAACWCVYATVLLGQRPMLYSPATTEMLLYGLLSVLWAPLVEETLFRGALHRELRRSLPWVVSAAMGAILFALYHDLHSLPHFWALVMFGLVAGAFREWRDSLVAPMVMHALRNGALLLDRLHSVPYPW